MTDHKHIRFSTDLITFYNSAFWGLAPDLPHAEWVAAFDADRRRYVEGMLDLAVESGVEGVEFAPDPVGWEAVLGVFGTVKALSAALSSRGLVVSSSYAPGRQLIGNAMDDASYEPIADDDMERHARFLAEMGADIIVTGNVARSRFGNLSPDGTATPEDFSAPVPRETHERFADQLNRLGGIVGRHGVRLAIHTDAYSLCSRQEDIATVMSLTDPVTVQLCPDAGHITLDGGDAVAVLRDNLARIPTMHWKDCIGPLSGHLLRGDQKARHAVMLTYFRIMGSGVVDWPEWMRVLRDGNWSGWATDEIDHSPDPVAELKTGLRFFDEHLAPIYQ